MNHLPIEPRKDGCAFRIQVVPRAGRSAIAGISEDFIRVKIAAPPVDGAANEACVEFFARLFRIPKSGVSILSGEHHRRKTILLRGVAPQHAMALLSAGPIRSSRQ